MSSTTTRKRTAIPFFGQPGLLPNLDLPANEDVIKHLKYKQLNDNKFAPIKQVISCNRSTQNTCEMECVGSGCCVLSDIKEKWLMAGLPIESDRSIKKKIETIFKEYSGLRESYIGPKVKSFLENAPKLFDIGHPNLRDIIKKDPNRTEQNKEDDIAFYDAKVDGRYGKLAGTQDQNFKNKIERKMKRIQKEEDLRLKEKERIAKTIPVNADEVDMIDLDLETHDQNENNEACWIDIEEPEAKRPRREKKSEYISINLPRKTLCKLTAPLARRYKISPRAQTAFLAKIIKIGGGNVKDFVLSRSSAQRLGYEAIKSESEKLVAEKIEKLSGKEIQLHFDGKSLQHYMEGKVETTERIAVIASSPEMEGEVLLGIPSVPTSSGVDQVNGILPLLEKYEIEDNIFSVNIDSTASNTGKWAGAATLLQNELDLAFLWIICRQ